MNFFSIFIYGYFLLAGYLIYIIYRDRKNPTLFFGSHNLFSLIAIVILTTGIAFAFDSHFIEPWTIKTTSTDLPIPNLIKPIKIAFISDTQVGNHKKTAWMQKIVKSIEQEKPDIVILGGDLIDNEGALADETQYLTPLQELADKFLTYAVLGNHEYGIGSGVVGFDQFYTGNRSSEVAEKLKILGIKLLKNNLDCPRVNDQIICLFGVDDIWGGRPNFSDLTTRDQSLPLIFITHNPDGILSWPENLKKPDLTLAGHTHGGQIYLPLLGPIGDAGIILSKLYYRGLNNYKNTPIFTSSGIGESGGAVRFWTLPEIAIIKAIPYNNF